MEWNTNLLYAAFALITTVAAISVFFNPRITTRRRSLTSMGALIALLTLVSGVYISNSQARINQHSSNPNIVVPIITEQNIRQIKLQAQADLEALLAPLWRQYEANSPGDYRSFNDFKQNQWLARSEAITEYYISLATANPSIASKGSDLYNLLYGFGSLNLMSGMMEQDLVKNGGGKDIRIMVMQIESLL